MFLTALLLFGMTSAEAIAQTRDDTGLWLGTFGTGKLASRDEDSPLRWWLDAQYRLRDDNGGFNQGLVRPGVGYALEGDQTLWAGYAWIKTSPLIGEDFDEHRLWQQWTWAPSIGDLSFLHRGRFEQRWLETGDDVGLRWRQFVRAQWAFTHTPQWSLVVNDEVFFHLNDTDWGARAGFDQNRAFLGFGFKQSADARTRIEVGYLNQFVHRRSGPDEINHILAINYFY